jgi:3D (Asp-Asp-Asp) domain-containing protein
MLKYVSILSVLSLVLSCDLYDSKSYIWYTKEVTATAYNSLAYQTNEQPNITAFGDTLTPGMKCIAVSRDLLKLGLKHNTLVIIEGLDGLYLVKDKMHTRWKNHIDIYMGNDVKAAKEWGRKRLKIKFRLEVKDSI